MDIVTVINAMRKAYDRILFFPQASPRRTRSIRQYHAFRDRIIKQDTKLRIELSNKRFEADFWKSECAKLETE